MAGLVVNGQVGPGNVARAAQGLGLDARTHPGAASQLVEVEGHARRADALGVAVVVPVLGHDERVGELRVHDGAMVRRAGRHDGAVHVFVDGRLILVDRSLNHPVGIRGTGAGLSRRQLGEGVAVAIPGNAQSRAVGVLGHGLGRGRVIAQLAPERERNLARVVVRTSAVVPDLDATHHHGVGRIDVHDREALVVVAIHQRLLVALNRRLDHGVDHGHAACGLGQVLEGVGPDVIDAKRCHLALDGRGLAVGAGLGIPDLLVEGHLNGHARAVDVVVVIPDLGDGHAVGGRLDRVGDRDRLRRGVGVAVEPHVGRVGSLVAVDGVLVDAVPDPLAGLVIDGQVFPNGRPVARGACGLGLDARAHPDIVRVVPLVEVEGHLSRADVLGVVVVVPDLGHGKRVKERVVGNRAAVLSKGGSLLGRGRVRGGVARGHVLCPEVGDRHFHALNQLKGGQVLDRARPAVGCGNGEDAARVNRRGVAHLLVEVHGHGIGTDARGVVVVDPRLEHGGRDGTGDVRVGDREAACLVACVGSHVARRHLGLFHGVVHRLAVREGRKAAQAGRPGLGLNRVKLAVERHARCGRSALDVGAGCGIPGVGIDVNHDARRAQVIKVIIIVPDLGNREAGCASHIPVGDRDRAFAVIFNGGRVIVHALLGHGVGDCGAVLDRGQALPRVGPATGLGEVDGIDVAAVAQKRHGDVARALAVLVVRVVPDLVHGHVGRGRVGVGKGEGGLAAGLAREPEDGGLVVVFAGIRGNLVSALHQEELGLIGNVVQDPGVGDGAGRSVNNGAGRGAGKREHAGQPRAVHLGVQGLDHEGARDLIRREAGKDLGHGEAVGLGGVHHGQGLRVGVEVLRLLRAKDEVIDPVKDALLGVQAHPDEVLAHVDRILGAVRDVALGRRGLNERVGACLGERQRERAVRVGGVVAHELVAIAKREGGAGQGLGEVVGLVDLERELVQDLFAVGRVGEPDQRVGGAGLNRRVARVGIAGGHVDLFDHILNGLAVRVGGHGPARGPLVVLGEAPRLARGNIDVARAVGALKLRVDKEVHGDVLRALVAGLGCDGIGGGINIEVLGVVPDLLDRDRAGVAVVGVCDRAAVHGRAAGGSIAFDGGFLNRVDDHGAAGDGRQVAVGDGPGIVTVVGHGGHGVRNDHAVGLERERGREVLNTRAQAIAVGVVVPDLGDGHVGGNVLMRVGDRDRAALADNLAVGDAHIVGVGHAIARRHAGLHDRVDDRRGGAAHKLVLGQVGEGAAPAVRRNERERGHGVAVGVLGGRAVGVERNAHVSGTIRLDVVSPDLVDRHAHDVVAAAVGDREAARLVAGHDGLVVAVELVFDHGVDDFPAVLVGRQVGEGDRGALGDAERGNLVGNGNRRAIGIGVGVPDLFIEGDGNRRARAVLVVGVVPDLGDRDRVGRGHKAVGDGNGLDRGRVVGDAIERDARSALARVSSRVAGHRVFDHAIGDPVAARVIDGQVDPLGIAFALDGLGLNARAHPHACHVVPHVEVEGDACRADALRVVVVVPNLGNLKRVEDGRVGDDEALSDAAADLGGVARHLDLIDRVNDRVAGGVVGGQVLKGANPVVRGDEGKRGHGRAVHVGGVLRTVGEKVNRRVVGTVLKEVVLPDLLHLNVHGIDRVGVHDPEVAGRLRGENHGILVAVRARLRNAVDDRGAVGRDNGQAAPRGGGGTVCGDGHGLAQLKAGIKRVRDARDEGVGNRARTSAVAVVAVVPDLLNRDLGRGLESVGDLDSHVTCCVIHYGRAVSNNVAGDGLFEHRPRDELAAVVRGQVGPSDAGRVAGGVLSDGLRRAAIDDLIAHGAIEAQRHVGAIGVSGGCGLPCPGLGGRDVHRLGRMRVGDRDGSRLALRLVAVGANVGASNLLRNLIRRGIALRRAGLDHRVGDAVAVGIISA